MNLHLTSIIPFTVALILLMLGLVYGAIAIQLIAGLLMTYAMVVHGNNVKTMREVERRRNRGYSSPYI